MLTATAGLSKVVPQKKIMDQIPEARYFEVELRDGAVVLKPLRTYSTSLEAIQSKVKNLDLSPLCVKEAITWARSK
jgi:hypothetical protein